MSLIALNKPDQVLSQFSQDGDKRTLASLIDRPGFYPAGRLDYDSEGLLLLTDDGALQARISSPRFKQPKTYWVQVEGQITDAALQQLASGVALKDGRTRPAQASHLPEPALWPRNKPIRERKQIPTSWLSLTLKEGRNRQVRRMTAAVGFPTLRLVRYAIGPIVLDGLAPGQWRDIDLALIWPQLLQPAAAKSVKPARGPRDSQRPRPHPHKPSPRARSKHRRS